ncbi:DNA repair protein RecO [Spiroplasma endosymbiont of Aspidapion aeneum]|uniref:DNA repair protein RecO n=1 Tax=Spiroplasma endosymbiont of Aspidapion aeneum TaxID=3066276 RepID=UPI00313DFBE6
MSFTKINAIVLNSSDIEYNKKVITVFSREFGKMSIYALGVNTMKSKNRYAIQDMSISQFEIFKARKKESMSKLKTGYIIESNIEIAKNIQNYLYLKISVDILSKLVDGEYLGTKKNAIIYDTLIKYLEYLRNDKNTFQAYLFFLCFLISFTGYIWILNKCIRCNKFPKKLIARFDYVNKGFVCYYCLHLGEVVQPDSFIEMLKDLKGEKYSSIIKKKYNIIDLVVLHNVLIEFYNSEVGIFVKEIDILKKNATTNLDEKTKKLYM